MRTIRAVLFDFDGTLSTLRSGWEEVMIPFMIESIKGKYSLNLQETNSLELEITDYIDQSTGIQTIHQMLWLAETVKNKGWNEVVLDAWVYKAEYNRRLLERVKARQERIEQGEDSAENYLMAGSTVFVRTLFEKGIDLYIASGTDHPDVVHEVELLGLTKYFKEISGAPIGKVDCSKEKVLKALMEERQLLGEEVAVIGDGKVEIRLGREAGCLALGLASDENKRKGLNPIKEKRLAAAGSDWIRGDFSNPGEWFIQMGL